MDLLPCGEDDCALCFSSHSGLLLTLHSGVLHHLKIPAVIQTVLKGLIEIDQNDLKIMVTLLT